MSCILTQLDGVERSKNVFFIATSSKPNTLDNALRRAGRIDKEIEINAPSPDDRYEILCSLLEELNINVEERDDATLRELMITSAHGMLASDLLQACKDAAVISLLLSSSSTKTIDEIDVNFEKLHVHDGKDVDGIDVDFEKMHIHDTTSSKLIKNRRRKAI